MDRQENDYGNIMTGGSELPKQNSERAWAHGFLFGTGFGVLLSVLAAFIIVTTLKGG